MTNPRLLPVFTSTRNVRGVRVRVHTVVSDDDGGETAENTLKVKVKVIKRWLY